MPEQQARYADTNLSSANDSRRQQAYRLHNKPDIRLQPRISSRRHHLRSGRQPELSLNYALFSKEFPHWRDIQGNSHAPGRIAPWWKVLGLVSRNLFLADMVS